MVLISYTSVYKDNMCGLQLQTAPSVKLTNIYYETYKI